MKKFFLKNSLINYFKEYKLAFVISFGIGIFISTIPYISKFIENYRYKQIIREEKKVQIKRKEKICKSINSDYSKFLNLGFPKTAKEKFNTCMQKQ